MHDEQWAAVHEVAVAATRMRLRGQGPQQVDPGGQLTEDYVADNLLVTWTQRARERSGEVAVGSAVMTSAEAKRYLYKSIHNRARDAWRKRTRSIHKNRTDSLTNDAGEDMEIAYHAPGYDQFEASQTVALLRRTMPPQEFALLERVASVSSVSQAYDPASGYGLRSFYQRVNLAKARARRIVEADVRC